ncbi:MAG: DUF2721 domain-containing protein [Thermodesulfobacteriota bacterium]
MDITLTTPALIFPTVSLLMVAYTNRFNALSGRIRSLGREYRQEPDRQLAAQISILHKRVALIRSMQACGLFSLFACVLCILTLIMGQQLAAKIIFAASLLMLMISLALSLKEVLISVKALDMELTELVKKD